MTRIPSRACEIAREAMHRDAQLLSDPQSAFEVVKHDAQPLSDR